MTVTEASDNSSVTITDTTADWEGGGIQDVYDNGAATLAIIVGGVVYDDIDIVAYFDGGLQSGLVFVITPDLLKVGAVAQFEITDDIPDGDWYITYAAEHTVGGAISDSLTEGHLIYGVVEKGVLDEIRLTDLNDWSFSNTLYEALIKSAHFVYLEGIKASAYESDLNSLREALTNLELMLENGTY
jgi:hypothetical protein